MCGLQQFASWHGRLKGKGEAGSYCIAVTSEDGLQLPECHMTLFRHVFIQVQNSRNGCTVFKKRNNGQLFLSSKYWFLMKLTESENDSPDTLQTVSWEGLVNLWWAFHSVNIETCSFESSVSIECWCSRIKNNKKTNTESLWTSCTESMDGEWSVGVFGQVWKERQFQHVGGERKTTSKLKMASEHTSDFPFPPCSFC